MCSIFVDEGKVRNIDSDETPTMLASRMFDKILHDVQSSNLNFQVQISPFSAQISIKKSLLKERNGSFRLLPIQQSYRESEFSTLESENKKLEMMLVTLHNEYAHTVDELSEANSRIKLLEECLDNNDKNEEEPDNDKVSQLATKTVENGIMKETIEQRNMNLKELENVLEVKNKVIENLNRNLNETKVKAKDENDALQKLHKADITSWKKKLGEERRQKIKLEKKLTNSIKEKDEELRVVNEEKNKFEEKINSLLDVLYGCPECGLNACECNFSAEEDFSQPEPDGSFTPPLTSPTTETLASAPCLGLTPWTPPPTLPCPKCGGENYGPCPSSICFNCIPPLSESTQQSSSSPSTTPPGTPPDRSRN